MTVFRLWEISVILVCLIFFLFDCAIIIVEYGIIQWVIERENIKESELSSFSFLVIKEKEEASYLSLVIKEEEHEDEIEESVISSSSLSSPSPHWLSRQGERRSPCPW